MEQRQLTQPDEAQTATTFGRFRWPSGARPVPFVDDTLGPRQRPMFRVSTLFGSRLKWSKAWGAFWFDSRVSKAATTWRRLLGVLAYLCLVGSATQPTFSENPDPESLGLRLASTAACQSHNYHSIGFGFVKEPPWSEGLNHSCSISVKL